MTAPPEAGPPKASASGTKALPPLVLADVLTRPSTFFAALAQHPRQTGRYFWLTLVVGFFSGIVGYFAARPITQALSALPAPYSGTGDSLLLSVISSTVSMPLLWLILWGLASLGVKKEARPAEVYGAALLVTLVGTLLLLPVVLFLPAEITASVPNLAGLSEQEKQLAVAKYTLEVSQQQQGGLSGLLQLFLNTLSNIWMFYVAYLGFLALTKERGQALRGTFLPAGLFIVISAAAFLLMSALGGMGS